MVVRWPVEVVDEVADGDVPDGEVPPAEVVLEDEEPDEEVVAVVDPAPLPADPPAVVPAECLTPAPFDSAAAAATSASACWLYFW